MDTTKKIIIGAIGAAVVVGAVSIGLIFGLAPADTDLSTIHTQEATSVPEATEPATVEESSSVQESETVKEGTTGTLSCFALSYSLRLILPEIFPFNIRW